MKESEGMERVLYRTLLNCTQESEMASLLADLCTPQEVEKLAQRAAAAQMLLNGKTYAEVIAETEISSATLSRVSRALRHGSGGYARSVPRE